MAYASKQSSAYKLKQTETTPARAAKPQMELVPETKKRRQQASAPVGKYAVMVLLSWWLPSPSSMATCASMN